MPAPGQEFQARPSDPIGYLQTELPTLGLPVTNSSNPVNLGAMVREISAGGVVVERAGEGWKLAVIEPQNEGASTRPARKTSQKQVLALPKGLVDPGEKPEQTALREVREETGLVATPVTKLGDIKYVYVRSWGDRQRVFKIVSFFCCAITPASLTTSLPRCGSRSSAPPGFPLTKLPVNSLTGVSGIW